MWITLLELETPFTHELIDLSSKPDEFLALSEKAGGTAKVPLLEVGESVVSESLDIVRLLGKDSRLLPAQGVGHIEPFIDAWVGQVASELDAHVVDPAVEREARRRPRNELQPERHGGDGGRLAHVHLGHAQRLGPVARLRQRESIPFHSTGSPPPTATAKARVCR